MIGAVFAYGVGALGVFIICGGEVLPWRKALGIGLLWPLFVGKFVLLSLIDGLEALFNGEAA